MNKPTALVITPVQVVYARHYSQRHFCCQAISFDIFEIDTKSENIIEIALQSFHVDPADAGNSFHGRVRASTCSFVIDEGFAELQTHDRKAVALPAFRADWSVKSRTCVCTR
jgi:hypothetical protein